MFFLFNNSIVHTLRLSQFALIFGELEMSDVDSLLLGVVGFLVVFQKLNLAFQKHLDFFLFKNQLLVTSGRGLNLSL